MDEPSHLASRRPLKSRGTGWARAFTRLLLRTPITPNQISTFGMLVSALGAWAFIASAMQPWLLLAGAACIQIRLLCNLFDGLVAVEGGRGSVQGALFNEVPDRVEDSFFLIAYGYLAGFAWLGFTAALLAAITAYVRTLGGSLGLPQDFGGPMAKQQRMAALTLGALAALAEHLLNGTFYALPTVLGIVTVGTLITIGRRLAGIARGLEREAASAREIGA